MSDFFNDFNGRIIDGIAGHNIILIAVMLSLKQTYINITMRFRRMNQRKFLLYLSIPVLFILTVIALTFHLLGQHSSDSRGGHPKLIANRGGLILSDNAQGGMALKFESTYNTDPLEKTYDADKLLMMGMVKTPDDERKKEEGK